MNDRMFFYRGYLQAFFIRLVGVVRWLFPMHSSLEVGSILLLTLSVYRQLGSRGDLAYLGG